jgi:hypothetical protein
VDLDVNIDTPKRSESSLIGLGSGRTTQNHPDSSFQGREFRFLLFKNKFTVGVSLTVFLSKNIDTPNPCNDFDRALCFNN